MDNLGTMEPEQLLQLLAGSVTCAFVIFLFIIVYFMISRRGRRTAKRQSLSRHIVGQETPYAEYRGVISPRPNSSVSSTPSGLMMGQLLADDEMAPVDVGARLVGTGREAWQEDEPTSSLKPSKADGDVPDQKQEVLRLLRDPSSGQVWVQVAGVRYRSLKGIRDRAVGERVLAAATHLLRFSKGMVATDHGVVTIDLPPCDAVKVPTAFGVLAEARESVEVVRLMTDPDQDQFCVHVVGQCYHRLVDVSQLDVGRFILEAITRFLQFSGGMLATNDGVGVVPVPPLSPDVHAPFPRPTTTSQPAQPSASPLDTSATIGEEERLLQQMMSGTQLQPQTPLERPSLINSLRRMRQGSSSVETPPPLNLADEIDRIFQSKLMASGLAATDAKVETNLDGGVRIRIGMDYYDALDEVPDPNLRDLLKLSIAEWEQG